MITTLDELVAHTRRVADRFPRIAHEILLESPGASPEDIDRLSIAIPGLGESYLYCLRRFSLAGVTLGRFEISPPMTGALDIVDALAKAQQVRAPYSSVLTEDHLAVVGAYESDPICVALGTSNDIVRIDLGDAVPRIRRLAKSFEQLLIAAGRLDELVTSRNEGWLVVGDFVESLSDLLLDAGQEGEWKSIAEEALIG